MMYIGFSCPKKTKIGSELIKWWICAPYSHVYLRFKSDSLPSSIYQAANGSVHFMSFERFAKTNTILKEYSLAIDKPTKNQILSHCISLASEKYGYFELLKIFFMDLAHKIKIPLEFHNSKGYICSELVGEVLKKHFQVNFKKPTYALSPKDIEEAILKL